MNYATEKKDRSESKRLEVATTGFELAMKTEDMVRKQSIAVCALCVLLFIIFGEWRIVKQTLFLGALPIAVEMINSSVERLCDMVQPEKDERIRNIKDMLAGTTLFVAVIGGFITAVDMGLLTYAKFFS